MCRWSVCVCVFFFLYFSYSPSPPFLSVTPPFHRHPDPPHTNCLGSRHTCSYNVTLSPELCIFSSYFHWFYPWMSWEKLGLASGSQPRAFRREHFLKSEFWTSHERSKAPTFPPSLLPSFLPSLLPSFLFGLGALPSIPRMSDSLKGRGNNYVFVCLFVCVFFNTFLRVIFVFLFFCLDIVLVYYI